jgi:cytidyltransferase-like protein
MIVETKQLGEIRRENSYHTIALRFGSFDLLHEGHRDAIEFASSQADLLVVGIMPDERVRKEKGADRPINPQNFRADTIDQVDGVDFSFVTPTSTVAIASLFCKLRPDVYVEHEEYGVSRLKSLFLKTLDVDYVINRCEKVNSTTSMIAKLGIEDAMAQSSQDFAES